MLLTRILILLVVVRVLDELAVDNADAAEVSSAVVGVVDVLTPGIDSSEVSERSSKMPIKKELTAVKCRSFPLIL